METYKNDYTKKEDELLWELHKIRHNLHKKWINKSLTERNKTIKDEYEKRKKKWLKKTKATA
jgi:hypothetical protein